MNDTRLMNQSKTLKDHSKKLLVFVEKVLLVFGAGSSQIPNIFSSLSILFLLLRIICSMVLFSISICLSSLANRSSVLLYFIVCSFIGLVAFLDLFHEVFQDGQGCLEELIVGGGYFIVEGLHIALEIVFLLLQKARNLGTFC